MTRSVRPSTPADAPAIVALFAQAGLRPNVREPELHWKYWERRGDWPGPRSWVLTNGAELLAHGALVPGAWSWEDRSIRTIHMIDWVARQGEIGAGVTLLKHVGRQADALLAIGGSAETLQIMPHVGFRSAGAVTGYVRTLHPWRLRARRGAVDLRLLPRVARGIIWALRAPAARDGEWRSRRLGAEEIPQLGRVLPLPARALTVPVRSVTLFGHMLGCPMLPVALFALERCGVLRGYFMLAAAPGQVRIADCWVDSGDPADWRAMLLCAVEQARQDPQAAEIVAWASHALLEQALTAGGFHARFRIPVLIRPSHGDAMPPVQPCVQMLDSDAAFLHDGRSESWA